MRRDFDQPLVTFGVFPDDHKLLSDFLIEVVADEAAADNMLTFEFSGDAGDAADSEDPCVTATSGDSSDRLFK